MSGDILNRRPSQRVVLMEWTIRRTDTFVESLSKVKENKEVIIELAKKLQRLKQDPLNTGGWLSGALREYGE